MTATGETLPAGERYWLTTLGLSRAFITLILMSYAAALPVLTVEWSMTSTQAGLVQTSLLVGFAVSLFVTSWLCDYTGARRMFLVFCWLAAAAALSFALFARTFEQALWLYALVGLTQGGCYTPAIMLVAQQMPPVRRGAGVGWVLAGMSAGYVGSISLTQAIMAVYGYETALLACALGTVVGAVFGTVTAARSVKGVVIPQTNNLQILALFKDRHSILLTIGYTGHSWELFGMWAWVPAFLISSLGDRSSMSAAGLGIAIAIALHLSGFFSSFSMGLASDRFGRRAVLLTVAALGALCSVGFGWIGDIPPALLLCVTAIYGFAAIGDSSVLSTAMSESVPAAFLGRALAVRSILGIGIGSAAPFAFGAVLDGSPDGIGWGLAFGLMGVGGVIAALCAALLPAEMRVHQPANGSATSGGFSKPTPKR